MAFKIEKAKKVQGHLRVLLYGSYKTGKTLFSVSAPDVLLLDVEGGANAYAAKYDFDVVEIRKYDDVMALLAEIQAGKHPKYKTVVIDSLTRIFNNLRDAMLISMIDRAKRKGYTFDEANGIGMQGHATVNRKMKQLDALIEQLKVNVIVIAHEKDILEQDDKKGFVKTGVQPDIHSKAPYAYDFILRTTRLDKVYQIAIEDGRSIEPGVIGKSFKNADWHKVMGTFKVDETAGTVPNNEQAIAEEAAALLEKEKAAEALRNELQRKQEIKTRIVTKHLMTDNAFSAIVTKVKDAGFSFEKNESEFEAKLDEFASELSEA